MRVLLCRTAGGLERGAGWSDNACCAAKGTACVIVATGKAQGQHAEP